MTITEEDGVDVDIRQTAVWADACIWCLSLIKIIPTEDIWTVILISSLALYSGFISSKD